MYPDEKYREYLLGLANAETEANVEEAILDGRVNPEHLQQIEDELIDDLLFNRLSAEEERSARSQLLSTPDRAARLEFARALQLYAAPHASEAARPTVFEKLRGLAATPWALPLTGALACCLLTIAWLVNRNHGLDRELAQVTQAIDEQQRIITAMQQERSHDAVPPVAPPRPPAPIPAPVAVTDQSEIQPKIQLSAGVSRGLAVVPVLHVKKQSVAASIVLELPFTSATALHEELLTSDGKQIWIQQFTDGSSITARGLTTIVLPAALLITGEYRLRIEAGGPDDSVPRATYLFRVRND